MYSIPADFKSSVSPFLGEEMELFLAALAEEAPVSFRVNPFKSMRNQLVPSRPMEPVPWSKNGYYLDERPAFTFDPLFHTGYYYVQEASSMFVEYVVDRLVDRPMACLDLCAAPGGKSVSLLSALPEGSLLVSNELIRQRANILSETMTKVGCPNVVVTNNEAKDFADLPQFFDLVLVDAPCSGEGMFRKDETAVKEWSLRNVEMCATRQREILGNVWSSLKTGGLLIYSTCTFNTTENEDNVRWIIQKLGAEFVELPLDKEWGITPADHLGYRFFPHKTKGEGFFVTVLRKRDSEDSISEREDHGSTVSYNSSKGVSSIASLKRKRKQSPILKDCSAYEKMLVDGSRFDFIEEDNRVIALPREYSDTLLAFNERLKVLSMGIEVGEKKGKSFIPSHSLAMSRELNKGSFAWHEVAYEEAIGYLRKEAITIPDAPLGYVIVTYQGEPLGFVKNLGSRANNLYPNEWRIRSGYIPEIKPHIFEPA